MSNLVIVYLRPFSLLDHLLCERLDRRRPMKLSCSRTTEVDPTRVETLHHFDIESRPVSRHTHRLQNVLPGSLGQLHCRYLTSQRPAERGRRFVQISSTLGPVYLQYTLARP